MLARLNNDWGLLPSAFANDAFGELFKLLDGVSETGVYRHAVPTRSVEENDKEIVINLFLPGFDQKDFDIEVVSDFITIKAKRKADELDKDASYLRRERSNLAYEESFSLSTKINNSKVKAKYRDGVLTITLPKQESETPRMITVK